ncbi:hypothetical protein FOXB_11853 [Fusarium oxysporum f. sp. conglutinans Fo5176]|uniref:Uncharacterized protein n=1 Tax=Fusarium oxysporum (strain Fo5176) TaxID=660025 RepID=F9FZM1_FUSOF|nr:hypothetical protein FOXB_11853 [Fusarium oxysporum f. sp. conglutinans Fo5176]
MGSLSLPLFRISEASLAKSLHESCQCSATHPWGDGIVQFLNVLKVKADGMSCPPAE